MKYAVLFCAVVATTLLAGETAFGCNYVGGQAIILPVNNGYGCGGQNLALAQGYYAPPQAIVVKQKFRGQQLNAGYGYSGQAQLRSSGRQRQNLDGGGLGIGNIVNRRNIITAAGAAGGAALFGPFGAAAGAVFGNIVAGDGN